MLKGLILKDLYEIRFQLICGGFLMLLPYVILAVMGDSITAGDSQMPSELSKMMIVVMFGMLNFICIAVFSSMLLNTVGSDLACGWSKYQRTMPVSSERIIGAKLLTTALVVAGLILISLAFNIIGIFSHGLNAEVMLAIPVICGLLQITALSPVFPVSAKIGYKCANGIYIGFELIVIIGAVVVMFMAFSNDVSPVVLRLIFYGALPAVTLLSVFTSYKAGKRAIAADL